MARDVGGIFGISWSSNEVSWVPRAIATSATPRTSEMAVSPPVWRSSNEVSWVPRAIATSAPPPDLRNGRVAAGTEVFQRDLPTRLNLRPQLRVLWRGLCDHPRGLPPKDPPPNFSPGRFTMWRIKFETPVEDPLERSLWPPARAPSEGPPPNLSPSKFFTVNLIPQLNCAVELILSGELAGSASRRSSIFPKFPSSQLIAAPWS